MILKKAEFQRGRRHYQNVYLLHLGQFFSEMKSPIVMKHHKSIHHDIILATPVSFADQGQGLTYLTCSIEHCRIYFYPIVRDEKGCLKKIASIGIYIITFPPQYQGCLLTLLYSLCSVLQSQIYVNLSTLFISISHSLKDISWRNSTKLTL